MPELPEVETVVRDIRPGLVGRRIASVTLSGKKMRRRWDRSWSRELVGRQVRAVRRRGKWILIDLDDGSCLVMHLGMSGQLKVMPAAAAVESHTHLVLGLKPGGTDLRFRDVRRFGSAVLFRDGDAVEQAFRKAKLGPEPFHLDPKYWTGRLATTDRCLKAVLLDQQVVAGVGNIYADEALFEARLHPGRIASRLDATGASRLRKAIATVLTRAIDRRGSTISDFYYGSGQSGGYQREFRVYGRTGEPCRRCREPIERIRLAGRSTHFCPRCQPPDTKS